MRRYPRVDGLLKVFAVIRRVAVANDASQQDGAHSHTSSVGRDGLFAALSKKPARRSFKKSVFRMAHPVAALLICATACAHHTFSMFDFNENDSLVAP
jgi:hypothetical protein